LPKIFHVNWFRKDEQGKFMWPGFGDNMRVLKWVIERCNGQSEAVKTPVGYVPKTGDIDVSGLDLDPEVVAALLDIDAETWRGEIEEIDKYFATYGDRLPQAIRGQIERIRNEIKAAEKAA
jgi:phosphoenolpyruvate carboxykinase (GTP)